MAKGWSFPSPPHSPGTAGTPSRRESLPARAGSGWQEVSVPISSRSLALPRTCSRPSQPLSLSRGHGPGAGANCATGARGDEGTSHAAGGGGEKSSSGRVTSCSFLPAIATESGGSPAGGTSCCCPVPCTKAHLCSAGCKHFPEMESVMPRPGAGALGLEERQDLSIPARVVKHWELAELIISRARGSGGDAAAQELSITL